MVWIRKRDSQKQTKKKTHKEMKKLDLSRLPADHWIDIHLEQLQEEGNEKQNFDHLILNIGKICTRGGTVFYGKRCTFYDPIDFGFVLRFKGRYWERKVDTSFFFLKKDVYVVAFCKSEEDHVGSNWFFARGTEAYVRIEGSKDAGFDIDYKDLSNCEVGFDVIGQGLHDLVLDRDVRENFLKVAHHISEAVRNSAVRDTISRALILKQNLPVNVYHFHHWKTYTKLWSNDYSGYDSEENETHNAKLQMVGFENRNSLGDMLEILLMENQEKRKTRRAGAFTLYERGSVSIDHIVKRRKGTKLAMSIADQPGVNPNPDIWICIMDALTEPDLRYTKLKIQHTDIFVLKDDLTLFVDDTGYRYKIFETKLPVNAL